MFSNVINILNNIEAMEFARDGYNFLIIYTSFQKIERCENIEKLEKNEKKLKTFLKLFYTCKYKLPISQFTLFDKTNSYNYFFRFFSSDSYSVRKII